MNIFQVFKKSSNNKRPILIVMLLVVFLAAGFPSGLIDMALKDANIIDNLYLSLKNGNVIDSKIKEYLGVPKVKAANFSMQTGYYVGNGEQMTISGLGFQPDFLIIKSNTAAISAVFKSSAMASNVTADFAANAINEGGEIIFNSDGFTIGAKDRISMENGGFTVTQSMNLTLPNIRYTYIAFTGSDCSATGNFCVGSYVGNGSATRDITVGFQPDFVMVKRSTAVAAHFKISSNPANETLYFINVVRDTTGNYIRSFAATSFQVGATDNALGGLYYYVAFKNTSGFMTQGSYAANNVDARSITGLGFKPDFVLVKNGTNATANNTQGIFNTPESYGDYSSFFTTVANTPNLIQELEPDGFEVGNSIYTNGSGTNTMYYVAFKGSAAFSSSGNYLLETGSYVGNGTNQNILNLKFKPDLVIIKGNTAQVPVFRTSLMAGDMSYVLGIGATQTNAILDLNNSGFSVGNSAAVNTNAVTYYWQAFGNAFNPHTNTGSSDFAIGYYIGNQIDNRNITRVPFQPDLVVSKSDQNYNAALKTSSMVGDLTGYFTATADTADVVQALNSDGFQVGTSATNRNSNYNGYLYHWFAFKQGSYFKVGTYTGNATDNRNITGLGINPNLLWVKINSTLAAVHRSSAIVGDSTQYFTNVANAANFVQNLITDGFQVGTAGEVNTNTLTYRYVAWAKPPDPSGIPGTPGNPVLSNVESGKISISWSAAANASGYRLERALELNSTVLRYKEVTKTASTSFTDTTGIGGNLKYWYRVIAYNSNGISIPSSATSTTTPAQSVKMQTGYYIGNQGDLSIQNIGFTPEFLIIKSNTASTTAVFETSISASLVAADVHSFAATADNQLANFNLANTRYTYTAFSGSDCSATGVFCVGTYNGNGTNPRDITLGFQPNFVMVKRSTAVAAHFKTATNPANETLYFAATVRDTTGNFIRSLGATSFQVGSTDNTTTGIYYYVAFKSTAGFMVEGSYTANNTDNRNITGLPFSPHFVFVKNATNATAANVNPVFSLQESYGDHSSFFSATTNELDSIQSLLADGFQVGNNIKVNGSTSDTFYYVAFGGTSAPSGSGTFNMAVGTYTGNGTSQSISGLTFKPDLVIIKNNTTQQSVFKTRLMGSDSTAYLASATANTEAGITSLNNAGFSVGNVATVNTSGNTYQWQAFGNAYNPHTNSGASDFAIGAYYGNAIDGRNIARLSNTFDYVVIKSFSAAGAATWRTSSMVGDLSSFFANTAEAANSIQALGTNNFNIGTSANTNTANIVYFWYGFKESPSFDVGNYTGNGTSQTINIGFQPNLVWTKSATTVNGVSKPSSLAGNASQYFAAVANVTTEITGLVANGFSVGAGTGANQNTITFRYAAWKIPPEGTLSVDIVDAGGASVASPSIAFNTIDTTFACQTTSATFGVANQKIRVTNTSSNPSWTLGIAPNTGSTSLWNSGGDNYDFNDSSGAPAGCSDGGDADSRPGQLSLDFSSAVITPQSGCSSTGITLGSSAGFVQGSVDSIVLVQASGSTQTNCYWDITGIQVTQKIPQDQASGNYNLNMSLTTVAN